MNDLSLLREWPVGAEKVGPLKRSEIEKRLELHGTTEIQITDDIVLKYAAISQRGHYPNELMKANQDKYKIEKIEDDYFFGVFDGHGPTGDRCAAFAREKIVEDLKKSGILKKKNTKQILKVISKAHIKTNEQLAKNPEIDDSMSGTTSCCLILKKNQLIISNVGDSRAMFAKIGEKARALSNDHTPYLQAERHRIKKKGGFILSSDQVDGIVPFHENWHCDLGNELDTDGDPPRVWHRSLQWPGTAFTRSIGDSLAQKLGVIAEPEFCILDIPMDTSSHLLIASDGIFEFLTMQSCIDIAASFNDPLDACRALTAKAYQLWIQKEERSDDISCILLKFIHTNLKQDTFLPPAISPPTTEEEVHSTKKKGRRGTILTPLEPIDSYPQNLNQDSFPSFEDRGNNVSR